MGGIDNRRWALSLALRAAVAVLLPLGLALILTAHTNPGGVDLMGAVTYFPLVLGMGLLGGRYAKRWEAASLDMKPGGALEGHAPWRRGMQHGVVCLAELSGVALVVALPVFSWEARVLVLVVIATAALVSLVLSYARLRWGKMGRELVLFIAESCALATLPLVGHEGVALRELCDLVVRLAMVLMACCLAAYGVAAVYRWRRERTVHARRARLLERAHVVAPWTRGE